MAVPHTISVDDLMVGPIELAFASSAGSRGRKQLVIVADPKTGLVSYIVRQTDGVRVPFKDPAEAVEAYNMA